MYEVARGARDALAEGSTEATKIGKCVGSLDIAEDVSEHGLELLVLKELYPFLLEF